MEKRDPRGNRLSAMARQAQRVVTSTEEPPVDPTAIDRAYRLHRARRRAQLERRRERSRARLRFLVATLVLAALALALLLVLWREIQSVFGL
jgi:hypothetical protein